PTRRSMMRPDAHWRGRARSSSSSSPCVRTKVMAQARRCRVRSFVLTALLAVLAPSASADIRAFNTALKSGDYRAASAAAAETWPGLDKAAPDIAVTAREFAWVSMLAGDPGKAQAYSSF